MSAAFDCVDLVILVKRLSQSFGLSGTVLSWFMSYFSGRTQQVLYKRKFSAINDALFAPQSSVLGPLLFLLYTAYVFAKVEKHGYKGHAFADDIQIVANCSAACFMVSLICFLAGRSRWWDVPE